MKKIMRTIRFILLFIKYPYLYSRFKPKRYFHIIFLSLFNNNRYINSIDNITNLTKTVFKKADKFPKGLKFNEVVQINKFFLKEIKNVYSCIDYSIMNAMLLYPQYSDILLHFGVMKENDKISGHAWVEMKKGRVLDIYGGCYSCTIVKSIKIKDVLGEKN